MTALTGQIAALLAAGPPDPDQQPMTPLQAARALTGRDVLVGELQALSVALTGPSSTARPALGPQHLVSDPLLVLREALHQLPRAVPDPGRPTDLLTPGGGAWGEIARAAVQLEAVHTPITGLPGPARWEVAGDLAALAGALGPLDTDLATQLPPAMAVAAAALDVPTTHGLVQLAADQLTAQLLGRPATDDHRVLLDAEPARAMLLRSPADLPAGMRRITEVLHDIGPGIAVLDVHGVARLLAVGLEHAGRQQLLDAAGTAAAGEAVRALRHAAGVALATPAVPDPRLRMLTAEVYRQVKASTQPGRTAAPLAGWLREAPDTTAALSAAVYAAGNAGRLFGRPGETRPEEPRDAGRLWVRVAPAEVSSHPAVVGLQLAIDALDQVLPEAGQAAGQSADARQLAASSAAGAANSLRSALRQRHAHENAWPSSRQTDHSAKSIARDAAAAAPQVLAGRRGPTQMR